MSDVCVEGQDIGDQQKDTQSQGVFRTHKLRKLIAKAKKQSARDGILPNHQIGEKEPSSMKIS